MLSSVAVGEELMPNRKAMNTSRSTQASLPTTPIRKLCRNRGLVMQEHIVIEDFPQTGDLTGVAATRKGKRKLL